MYFKSIVNIKVGKINFDQNHFDVPFRTRSIYSFSALKFKFFLMLFKIG